MQRRSLNNTSEERKESEFWSQISRCGETVNKAGFINAVQSSAMRYEAFNASDIKVHIFRETAVVTCLWSARAVVRGQNVNSQMRVMHIYVNSGSGWKVVAGQASPLPPYTPQAL